jgi:hypothetical protein
MVRLVQSCDGGDGSRVSPVVPPWCDSLTPSARAHERNTHRARFGEHYHAVDSAERLSQRSAVVGSAEPGTHRRAHHAHSGTHRRAHRTHCVAHRRANERALHGQLLPGLHAAQRERHLLVGSRTHTRSSG